MNRVITRVRHVTQFGTVAGWSEDESLMPSLVSSAPKCTFSWFHAFGPANANAWEPKCAAEELTTRSLRVVDRSLCQLPADVTGRQRSAIYGGAYVCLSLSVCLSLCLSVLLSVSPDDCIA